MIDERDLFMEIRDYVGRAGWRLWILVLLPVAAGGAAFASLADTPTQYEAETVLTVPSSVAGGASSGSVAQYMANFEQAIVSDPVVRKVADTVGLEPGEVRDGLDVTQFGSSNLVGVSYRGPDPGDASIIVEEATRSTFDLVAQIQLPFGQSLDVLRSRVENLESDLEAAEARLEEFLVDNGLVLPREQYLMVAGDVARLEDELAQAQAAGTPPGVIESELRDRRKEMQRLAEVIPEYEQLQTDVERTSDDLDAAQDEFRLTEAQLAHLRPQTTAIATERIPELQTIGKGVGVAAAGGFIVAMLLLLMLPSKASAMPPQPLMLSEPPAARRGSAAGR